MNVENGFSFWETLQTLDCVENKLEVIYEGNIQATTETRENSSKLHYFVSKDDMIATLKLNGIHDLCHMKFIKTDFSNLYIIEDKNSFSRPRDIYPDSYTYIIAKIVHVEGKIESDLEKLYLNTLHKECESSLAILRESLSVANLSPDSFAFDLMGPGFMAHISGELIHIAKCLPVEEEVREDLDTCYNHIPVVYNSENMFLSHKTKILMKHGVATNCNKLLRIGFKINNKWYTFTPKLMEIEQPQMLKPNIRDEWEPEINKNLATAGIYSESESTPQK